MLRALVLADRQVGWCASPALPGARHDMGAAREHGLIDGLNSGGIRTIADTAYQGGGEAIRVPHRRRRTDPDSRRRFRRLSQAQKVVNAQPTPASAARENERTPSSSPGRSSARSAATPARRPAWPRP